MKDDERFSSPPPDEDPELRALLRRALAKDEPEPPRDFLQGVQQRIHRRSRGKFYRDGWSRTTAPASLYVVTSLVMLVMVFVLYLVLTPAR